MPYIRDTKIKKDITLSRLVKLMLYKYKVLFGFMLASCTDNVTQDVPNVYVEDEFNQEEQALIQRGFNEWHRATDSSYTLKNLMFGYAMGRPFEYEDFSLRDSLPMVQKLSENDPGYIYLSKEIKFEGKDRKGYGNFVGLASSNLGVLLVHEKIAEKSKALFNSYQEGFYNTLLHELGHFYGVRHIFDERSVMWASGTYEKEEPALCIDELTLEAYCIMYPCGENAGSTCNGRSQ